MGKECDEFCSDTLHKIKMEEKGAANKFIFDPITTTTLRSVVQQ